MWRKMSCFELATRVPFILHVPWLKETAGTRSKQLVELVDVLPTLLVSPTCLTFFPLPA